MYRWVRPNGGVPQNQLFRARFVMLAEKFILVLEALLKSNQYPDGGERVRSPSSHVPITLPTKKY
jgi:hypothetical protein